jgi:glutamate-ammonia-ligase adenylyltransferase
LVKPGQINVKYGAGGIIDIEYTVQYRQILHGRDHPELRAPNTLQALEALSRLGILPRDDCATLRSAYLFLRNVIDALRIVRGDARDLVLPDPSSEEFKSLARRLGYCEGDRKQSAVRLYSDVREQMSKASAEFEKNPARR